MSVVRREVCIVSSTLLDRKTLVNQIQEVWVWSAEKKITGKLPGVKLKLIKGYFLAVLIQRCSLE